MKVDFLIKSTWDSTPTSLKPLANNPLSRVLCSLLLFGGFKYYSHYRLLLKSQWWDIKKMEEHRFSLLKKVLKHVYFNVPFYNTLFRKACITPGNIKSINDLEKIPIITKEDVLRGYDNFFSRTTKKEHLKTMLTGGSTGKPLTVNYDNNFWAHALATERFIKNIAGFDDFSLRLSVPGNGPFYKRTKNAVEYNPVTRQLFFSYAVLSEDILKDYVTLIRKFKPHYMDVFPYFAYHFAKFLAENNITDITFDSILCVGEVLYDFQRKFIEKQFDAEVFNYYGHNELLCLSVECEKHNGMHISELGLVEVVDKDGQQAKPGKSGRIIATTLYNHAWPLIRYDTGDIGQLETEPCSCGRGLLRIKEVQGRRSDMIKLPDGKVIPSNYFAATIEKFSFAKQFQFVQEDEKTLILKIVKKKEYHKKREKHLISHLKNLTDNSINIHIQHVDNIDLIGRRNKYRYIISNIK